MTGPLAGLNVLDFGQIVSAPMAAMWLGDQGADVIKVEGPEGDPMAILGPRVAGLSAIYAAVNRGKQLEELDLSRPESRARLDQLIAWADVLIQNFRPGVGQRLGLGWDRARTINPRLIYVEISGFGPDGPYAGQRAYDMSVQAVSGLAGAQGIASGRPALMAGIVADKVTALTAAQAATAALYERENSGVGQRIEIAMLDAALAFHWPDGMWGQAFAGGAPEFPEYAALSKPIAAKGGAVVLGAMQFKEAEALMRVIGADDMLADERFASRETWIENAKLYWRMMRERIAETDIAALRAGFIREEAVGAAINQAADVPRDPQVQHRGSIAEVEQPGVGTMYAPRHPPRFSRTPAHAPRPAPRRGH